MSHKKRTVHKFKCDGEDCRNRVEYEQVSSKRYALKLLRRDGWSAHSGGHYCPECNTKDTPACPNCGSWDIRHPLYRGPECRGCGETLTRDCEHTLAEIDGV